MTPSLKMYTILLRAERAGQEFITTYEVIAGDETAAARFALADLAARGEKALDVERVEVVGVANPLTPQGVRFRTGRMYFEG